METIIEHLIQNPIEKYIWFGLLGATIGSFLNVVIIRLPIMLKRGWQHECYDFLEITPPKEIKKQRPLNLMFPRSHCPSCLNAIKFYDNIPIISFLLLKGRCRSCQHVISWRYPMVELLTLLLTLLATYRFGISLALISALILTWALIAQSLIDLEHTFIPDDITLPILWLGLFVNMQSVFVDIHSALYGAAIGYLSLWSLYWLFKLATKKEGMGYGDFKLLAMLGAWLGVKMLPFIILCSSLLGAIVGIGLVFFKQHDKSKPIPFGPYLAIAGFIALLWGNEINYLYFYWMAP